MNVYIDCGAYNGDTLDCNKLFNFKADYIVAFEPNPKFFSVLAGKPQINELHNAVVWTQETIVEFSVDKNEPPLGSSVMQSKKTYSSGEVIEMHSIDFSEYIKQFKDDHVLVKMDIEGAEFPVLDKLIQDGTIKYIDRLAVEFHHNKVTDYTTTDKNNLVKQLESLTDLEEWLQ